MERKATDEGFIAYLQELADLKRPCTIKYRSVEGGVAVLKAHILEIQTVAGRQMIETDAGMHIGVDQLVEVNGRVSQNYC